MKVSELTMADFVRAIIRGVDFAVKEKQCQLALDCLGSFRTDTNAKHRPYTDTDTGHQTPVIFSGSPATYAVNELLDRKCFVWARDGGAIKEWRIQNAGKREMYSERVLREFMDMYFAPYYAFRQPSIPLLFGIDDLVSGRVRWVKARLRHFMRDGDGVDWTKIWRLFREAREKGNPFGQLSYRDSEAEQWWSTARPVWQDFEKKLNKYDL